MNRFKPLILIFALLFSGPLFGEESTEESTGSRIVGYGDDDHSTSSLEQMLEQPFVAAKVENCKSVEGVDTINDQVMDCLWNDEENGLKEDEKAKVYEMLAVDGDDGEQYNSNLSNYKIEKSDAVKKLETYLGNKLEEALTKDAQEKGIKATSDHVIFYKLYRSQLGQNLIRQISSYCIYADEDGFFPDPNGNEGDISSSLKSNRQKNLDNLNELNANQDQSLAYKGFSTCIQNIGRSCQKNEKVQQGSTQYIGLTNPAGLEVITACELNRMMTSVKKSIEKTSDLITEFGNLEIGKSIQVKNANMTEVKISELTNMGSKELVADSGYEEESKSIAEDIKNNCQSLADPSSDPNCKKYLTSKEDNDAIANENEFRNRALASKVKSDLAESKNDIETIKKIYKEQGLSDEEFDKLLKKAEANTSCNTPEDCLAQQINDRYENEQEAINNALRAKLKKTEVDPDDASSGENALKGLAEKYENAAQNLAEIYQYANVVSSFIDIDSGDGSEKMKNTAALSAELENNYFSAASNSARDNPVTERDLGNLAEFGSDAGSNDGSDDVNLSNGMINEIQWGIGGEESAQ